MFEVICSLTATLSFLLSPIPSPLFFDGPPPGYGPANANPEMTASASAPVTVSVSRYNPQSIVPPAVPQPIPPPKGSPFTYSITATDKDTYVAVIGGVNDFVEAPDYSLTCTPSTLQYQDVSNPVFRGAANATTTWDVSGYGVSVPNGVPVTAAICYNTYVVSNTNVVLAIKDTNVTVTQTIHVPQSYP